MGRAGDLELVMLLAIHRLGDDAYGVTVLDELERHTSRALTLGTVYKTLARLEEKSWVRTEVAPPTGARGGRRRKLYRLTSHGMEAARTAIADLRQLASGLDPELEVP